PSTHDRSWRRCDRRAATPDSAVCAGGDPCRYGRAMVVEPVARPGAPEAVRRLIARTIGSCFRYRVTGLAAEAAFFAILSLPPLVFGLAGTIGFVAERYDVSQVDVLKDRIIDVASKA